MKRAMATPILCSKSRRIQSYYVTEISAGLWMSYAFFILCPMDRDDPLHYTSNAIELLMVLTKRFI